MEYKNLYNILVPNMPLTGSAPLGLVYCPQLKVVDLHSRISNDSLVRNAIVSLLSYSSEFPPKETCRASLVSFVTWHFAGFDLFSDIFSPSIVVFIHSSHVIPSSLLPDPHATSINSYQ